MALSKSISIKLDVGVSLSDCLLHKLKNRLQMRLNSWFKLLLPRHHSFKLPDKLGNLCLIENRVARWVNKPQTLELCRLGRRQESSDEMTRVWQLCQTLSSLVFPAQVNAHRCE